MNVVIYVRYSSHSQTEQSIEGQLQTCYEYAKANGQTIVGEYIDGGFLQKIHCTRRRDEIAHENPRPPSFGERDYDDGCPSNRAW